MISKLLISSIERPINKINPKMLKLSVDINRLYPEKIETLSKTTNVCAKFVAALKQKVVQVRDYPFVNQLGEGSFGKAYKFDAPRYLGDGFVVKVSHPTENAINTIKNEAEMLAQIPNSVKHSQKLIAHFKFDNKYYLVTNFVKGTSNGALEDFSVTSIKSLANDLIELDKAKIFHMDLAPMNLKVCNDDVNILDYGFARKIKPFEHADYKDYYCRPAFCIPSNIIDFEDKTLFPFIDEKLNSSQNVRGFFQDYLKTKAETHKQRISFLEQEFMERKQALTEDEIINAKQAIKYEKLEAEMLKNPTEDIIDLEALKSQIAYSNRVSDIELWYGQKFIGFDKKSEAIGYANKCKEKAQQMLKESSDLKTKDYLNFQIKYADYWLNNLTVWRQGLIDSGFNSRGRFPYDNLEKPADKILKSRNQNEVFSSL